MGLRLITYVVAVFTILAVVPTISTPAIAVTHTVSKKKNKKAFFKKCKKSGKFNERQVNFGNSAKMAGRCVTSLPKNGVKTIGSRPGHQPSAGRAIDIMTNTSGSCTAGHKNGTRIAKYFMNNSKKFHVKYIIWNNKYWSADTRRVKPYQWRYMGRGGCTQGHHDHVHVAFK